MFSATSGSITAPSAALRAASAVFLMSLAAGGCLAAPQAVDPAGAPDASSTSVTPPRGMDAAVDGGASMTPGADAAPVVVGEGPYCEVAATVFIPRCTACHRMGGTPPDLTFDGARNLAGATSTLYPGATLVVAGDPAASLVFRKVTGTQAAHEGARMPIGATLSAAEIALVEAWIQGGAQPECDAPQGGDGGVVVARYHPNDFARPDQHGIALTSGAQDCRTCHGATLEGGAAPSCDSCHAQGWRTNCTFCHGGLETMGGAPPRGLLGQLARDEQTFRPHTEHVSVRNHRAYDCSECHLKPTNVMSVNHVFDDSPGQADVTFEHGLSRGGSYDGNGGCSNLYCHGNGQASNGSMRHENARPDCSGCHGGPGRRASWGTLSGRHEDHLEEGLRCSDCHAATVTANNTIGDPDRHVNGVKDVVFAPGTITRGANMLCGGSCHGERHTGRDWFGGDDDDD